MGERKSGFVKMARAVGTASDRLNWVVGAVAVAFFACLVLVVGLKIVARYVIAFPMPWTEEISRFLLTWIALLGISVAFRQGELVASYYLVSKLRKRAIWVVFAMIQLALVVLLTLFLVEGWSYAASGLVMRTPILRMRIFYSYAAIPLCAALCLFHQAAFVLNINETRLQSYIQQEMASK